MLEGPVVRFEPTTLYSRRRDPWEGVHLARYNFAAPRVEASRVLDVACGTGYGLSVLRARARDVVGIDMDLSALRKAPHDCDVGRNVVLADCRRIPFADGAFDVITSFETLEHIENRPTFIRELRRVLSPDGLLILSTPNANHTEPVAGIPQNPHHVHEYRPSELRSELEARFENVTLLGQTLNPRIVIPPFADEQQKLPRTLRVQCQLLVWRVLNKLPPVLHDRISQFLWGHRLIAGDRDYEFRENTHEEAPVLVALCRGETCHR